MKNWKKILAAVLCLTFTPVSAIPAVQTETVQAAEVKTGFKKENGKYYYYKNGERIRNTWKNITVQDGKKTKTGRYYFGANGAAYAGKKFYGVNTPAIKKIDGKTYGFGTEGRMLKGTYVVDGEFYAFNTKTGVYDPVRTNKLRKAAGYEKPSAELRKLMGKPKKTVVVDGCYGDGKDYILYYSTYFVILSKNKGKEVVLGASGI